ncbi:MAG: hypothetical protein RIC95_06540 [Vicingaceae bacterium]
MRTLKWIVFSFLSLLLLGVLSFYLYLYQSRWTADIDLCGWGKTFPYYVASDYYQVNFLDLKNHFISNTKSSDLNTKKDFIIRIRFLMNCNGEIGQFKVKSYDFDYREIDLSPTISKHFTDLLANYQKWTPPLLANGEAANIHAFYSFRIKQGEIIEVLPK